MLVYRIWAIQEKSYDAKLGRNLGVSVADTDWLWCWGLAARMLTDRKAAAEKSCRRPKES